MSGHLYADYDRLSGLLGLPACSNTQWSRIVKRLEEQVTELAKWSCGHVQQEIIRRGGDVVRSSGLLRLMVSGPLFEQLLCYPP